MTFERLLGKAPNFQALLKSARQIAATEVTVLIVGETGTGKDILARALQDHSPRSDKPFITVNCAAMPESLAESSLFGHRKGSFTGAIAEQLGRIPAAHSGTVFLDEIDSLPLALQAKLLRFLDSGEIQIVGEPQPRFVDVRVLAASNANLKRRVEDGSFRRDLYYRLSVTPLEIPPLRDRRSDIPMLADCFLRRFAAEHRLIKPVLTQQAVNRLVGYHWPGNVRELRNTCERLAVLLAGRSIGEADLPEELRRRIEPLPFDFDLPAEGIRLEEVEMDMIRQALQRTNGNRSRAARLLCISRDALLYRMKKYCID